MKKIKPVYYDDFRCIADKCEFTCCREWKIAVDERTLKVWEKTKTPECAQKPGQEYLSRFVTLKDGTTVIVLDKNGNCPFLNKDKLCKLVMEHGDGILSKTCAEFPRQRNVFGDREEFSLVSCCPAVLDILNSLGKFGLVDDTGDDAGAKNYSSSATSNIGNEKKPGDEERRIRDWMIEFIQDKKRSVNNGLMILFYLLLEYREHGEFHMEQAVTDAVQQAVTSMEFVPEDTFTESNELLLDLAENYRKEKLYGSYLDKQMELADRISAGEDTESVTRWLEYQDEFSRFSKFCRSWLASEFFTNLLMEGDTASDMVQAFEWILMEYTAFRQLTFLDWVLSDEREISYEKCRDALVLISRMTGYDREDILEYLENSFESAIWDWGYAALLTGR